MGSVAGDVAVLAVLHQVCRLNGSRKGSTGGVGTEGAGDAKAVHQAGFTARSLVRGMSVGQLRDVVETGERVGWGRELVQRSLAQGCAGEKELAGKVDTVFL